jgi:membrane-bound lytic murein transglycosylase D
MRKFNLLIVLCFLGQPSLALPSGLQQPHFPTPSGLTDAIDFWKSVFTEHDSSKIVIHDREHMDIIWQVVELPKDRFGRVDEFATPRYITRLGEDFRSRLRYLELTHLAKDDVDERLLIIAAMYGYPVLNKAEDRIRLQRGVANHFKNGLTESQKWLPQMQVILKNQNVPVELAALPFVESTFNPKARSSVGAAGIWQLMPRTAKALGLKVSRAHDERMDILKATQAAARMLKSNHQILGTWPLAITAYNHGPNGVRRAVSQVGSDDLMQLIENYDKRSWGFASKNFYAEFLAALDVLGKTHPNNFPTQAPHAAAD